MNALAPAFYTHGGKDPTTLTWPPTMLIELALKTASPDEIRQEYGYSVDEWLKLPQNPAFLRDLNDACVLVKQEGMSFRLKAKLLAEDFLPNVYRMVNASDEKTPPSVKADLIKAVTRWAGYDQKAVENGGAVVANSLNIQINLGDAE